MSSFLDACLTVVLGSYGLAAIPVVGALVVAKAIGAKLERSKLLAYWGWMAFGIVVVAVGTARV